MSTYDTIDDLFELHEELVDQYWTLYSRCTEDEDLDVIAEEIANVERQINALTGDDVFSVKPPSSPAAYDDDGSDDIPF